MDKVGRKESSKRPAKLITLARNRKSIFERLGGSMQYLTVEGCFTCIHPYMVGDLWVLHAEEGSFCTMFDCTLVPLTTVCEGVNWWVDRGSCIRRSFLLGCVHIGSCQEIHFRHHITSRRSASSRNKIDNSKHPHATVTARKATYSTSHLA